MYGLGNILGNLQITSCSQHARFKNKRKITENLIISEKQNIIYQTLKTCIELSDFDFELFFLYI